MPQTKLIYGVGRIPKASEFQLGEVIVNVDDSKVYSKSKSNVVFEIGTNNTGSSTTSAIAFSTASAFGSGIITAQEGSNTLIISGGSGITVATGSNNDLIISSVGGQADSDWFIDTVNGRLTASLDVYTKGNITGSNLSISGSGSVNFDPNGDSPNFESVAIRYRFGEDSDGDSKRIVFLKTPGGTYKTRFQQKSVEYLLLSEQSGVKTFEINQGNQDANQVNFIVYDKNDNYNIFATASGKVGIGTSIPEEKLTVAGNISASGFLRLTPTGSNTAFAGALMYSSSNEFYLGFS